MGSLIEVTGKSDTIEELFFLVCVKKMSDAHKENNKASLNVKILFLYCFHKNIFILMILISTISYEFEVLI